MKTFLIFLATFCNLASCQDAAQIADEFIDHLRKLYAAHDFEAINQIYDDNFVVNVCGKNTISRDYAVIQNALHGAKNFDFNVFSANLTGDFLSFHLMKVYESGRSTENEYVLRKKSDGWVIVSITLTKCDALLRMDNLRVFFDFKDREADLVKGQKKEELLEIFDDKFTFKNCDATLNKNQFIDFILSSSSKIDYHAQMENDSFDGAIFEFDAKMHSSKKSHYILERLGENVLKYLAIRVEEC